MLAFTLSAELLSTGCLPGSFISGRITMDALGGPLAAALVATSVLDADSMLHYMVHHCTALFVHACHSQTHTAMDVSIQFMSFRPQT